MGLPPGEGPTGQVPSQHPGPYPEGLSRHKIFPIHQVSCWGVRHKLGKISDNFLPCAHPSSAIALGGEPGVKMHLEAEAGLQVEDQLQARPRKNQSACHA